MNVDFSGGAMQTRCKAEPGGNEVTKPDPHAVTAEQP